MRHIIYIPGLGDRYDGIRKLGLRFWNRKDIRVSHIAMNWLDPNETLQEKLQRIENLINKYPDDKVTLVGESAGGAMAIVAKHTFKDRVDTMVTLCGMNQGSGTVSPTLYKRNPAFLDAMLQADLVIPNLKEADKRRMFVIYSSTDFTVRPRNSLIPGVESHDLKIAGHMFAILAVLFFQFKLITNRQ